MINIVYDYHAFGINMIPLTWYIHIRYQWYASVGTLSPSDNLNDEMDVGNTSDD